METTLGGFTKKHGLMILLSLPTLAMWGALCVVSEDAEVHLAIVAVLAGTQVYWILVAAVNRWTVRAHEHGVTARYGPLPWFFLKRDIPRSDIRGFLSVGDRITIGETEHSEGRAEVVGAGIDVLHPDGYTTNLVRSCSDFAKVSRLKAELEARYGVAAGPAGR